MSSSSTAMYREFADWWRRLSDRWPMAVISAGVIGSFVWVALLAWLLMDLIQWLV